MKRVDVLCLDFHDDRGVSRKALEGCFPVNYRFFPVQPARIERAFREGDFSLAWLRVSEGRGPLALAAAVACTRAGLPVLASGAGAGAATGIASYMLKDEEPDSVACFAEDFLAGKAAGTYSTAGHSSHEGIMPVEREAGLAARTGKWLRRVGAALGSRVPERVRGVGGAIRPRRYAIQ